MDRVPQLVEWLAGHRPADPREAEHLRAMQDLLATGDDPFRRDRFEPGHFTASGAVISPDGGEMLLIHHRRLDRWLQPGGHVEPGDADLAAAARREVAEEAGLSAIDDAGDRGHPFDLDVHSIPSSGGAPEHRHFDVRFLFRARSRTVSAASDARDARWVPLADIVTLNPEPSFHRMTGKLTALHRVAAGGES